MGKNIYFTEKEIEVLRSTSGEWCDMMSDGDDDSCNEVKIRLDSGLGSALKKLYKGLNGEKFYKGY